MGTVVGNDRSRSTWSATPPMHLGVYRVPFCLAIPPKNGQSRSLSSGFNIGARSLVLSVQEAVAFLFQQKEDPGGACSRSSQVSGIVSWARPVELFRYRYTAGDGLSTP